MSSLATAEFTARKKGCKWVYFYLLCICDQHQCMSRACLLCPSPLKFRALTHALEWQLKLCYMGGNYIYIGDNYIYMGDPPWIWIYTQIHSAQFVRSLQNTAALISTLIWYSDWYQAIFFSPSQDCFGCDSN